ncbi:sensor histidine kinase [Spirillospora sp. CA-294931]|uniref:sensor histidine kinase n=1 Tax=Spirillospora sp. CA-294931 TaxID=3240042 RepID=UPI003D93EBE4
MRDPAARLDRIHSVGGCLIRSLCGLGAALFLLLCVISADPGPAKLPLLTAAALAAAGSLLSRGLERWAMAVSFYSLALSLTLISTGDASAAGPAPVLEIAGLLLLIIRVAWRVPRSRLIPMTALTSGAVVATALRTDLLGALVLSAPLGLLAAVAIGTGLYLRAIAARRTRAVREARRDERLELARDLHDFVAHHVTGIVVQAQAARFAAQSGAGQSPEQLDTMFEGIETAGTEALTSMRRMVGLLREAQGGDAATRPVGDLAKVSELVASFTDPPATLAIAPDLGMLPPEVTTSVHRVAQEALTNARKHAADATGVHVAVCRLPGGAVEVAVRDDGQGRGRRLPSGGFGLTGLRERVEALDGELRAGPRPEGGWEVVAVLPVRPVRETLEESPP